MITQHAWRAPVMTAAATLLFVAAPAASAHRMEKHFTVGERPVIMVRNSHGRVEIQSWKKPEVVVIGNHNSNKVEVDTEQAGNRIEVTTHVLDENVNPADVQADYQITVPEESELHVRTDLGEITVERVFGDMTFDTVAADVQLQEVAGYMVVKTIGGSVLCARCAGRIDVRSISGNVRFLQPQMDNVRVETTSGNIYYDGDFHRGGIYSLKTGNGLLEVRFADTDSFDLTAATVNGRIENQAKIKPHTHERRSPSRFGTSLVGTFNDGHARVELSSFSGTIRILKRD